LKHYSDGNAGTCGVVADALEIPSTRPDRAAESPAGKGRIRAGSVVVFPTATIMERSIMNTHFLAFVESRWTTLSRNPGGARINTVASRPSVDQLILDVTTAEATAQIKAREALRTLDITVSRFKDQKTLCEGACAHETEAERRLRKLLIELSASPFN
jgi:hypothetical protein